jgi:hypothetical protein
MTLAYFIGDSLVSALMAQTCADLVGWTIIPTYPPSGTLDGVGGSGYLNPGSGEKFEDRLDHVFAAAPSVVFVIGGGNDNGLDTTDSIAAAQSFWAALRAGLPGALLFASALHRPCAEPKNAGQIASCRAAGGTYIDGSAWTPELSDGVHPTDPGKVYLGSHLAYQVGARFISGILTESGSRLMLEVPA